MIENSTDSAKPFHFAVVLLPKFSPLTLSSLIEPLRIANYCDGEALYQRIYLSVEGGAVQGASGYSVETESISADRIGCVRQELTI